MRGRSRRYSVVGHHDGASAMSTPWGAGFTSAAHLCSRSLQPSSKRWHRSRRLVSPSLIPGNGMNGRQLDVNPSPQGSSGYKVHPIERPSGQDWGLGQPIDPSFRHSFFGGPEQLLLALAPASERPKHAVSINELFPPSNRLHFNTGVSLQGEGSPRRRGDRGLCWLRPGLPLTVAPPPRS